MLRREPPRTAPRLRIHSGGAPTPPGLIEAFGREFGIDVQTGWGMTELSPVGMVTHPRRITSYNVCYTKLLRLCCGR